MRSIEASGKSVDEAIFNGLNQLGISIDEVTITVVQHEKKGVLGIGAKPAVVRLDEKEKTSILNEISFTDDRKKKNNLKHEKRDKAEVSDKTDKTARIERPVREKPRKKTIEEYFAEHENEENNENSFVNPTKPVKENNVAGVSVENNTNTEEASSFENAGGEIHNRRRESRRPRNQVAYRSRRAEINYTEEAAQDNPAAEFVKELMSRMGVEGKVLAYVGDDGVKLRIDSEMIGILIGHRGETLDAIQYLTSLVVNRNRKEDGYTRVTIDTEGYRDKREETLIRLARKVASQVKATGKSRTLEPMNPYERRILHSTLQNNPFVETYSEGDEPNRRVVVVLKKDRQRREVKEIN